jgi:undecaprenyl-diphosphatase
MPRPVSAFLPTVLLSLPLLLVAGGSLAVFGSEAAVTAHFLAWRAEHQALTQLLTFYTDYGNAAFYFLYAGMLVRALRRRDKDGLCLVLGYLAAQLLISLLAVRVLKMSIGRARPMTGGPAMPFTVEGAYHSMPSGHSVEMTLQTLPLALRAKTLALPLLLGLALGLMALTRIALGWHHPTDVLAGWVLGGLGGLLALGIAQQLKYRLNLGWKT